jgi:ParB family transcriptional regulator, chromosome partitioning protein
MSENAGEIRRIPIAAISIMNPRVRGKKGFRELVASIAALGLKKPVTVRLKQRGEGYDLVCGQGRLEAFKELGELEIPAIVIKATLNECFIMSLVENLARRHHTPMELIRSIAACRERGNTASQIATMTGFSYDYIAAICFLLDHGEHRLLVAVERGAVPHTIAMEIARAKDGDVQAALLEAFADKKLPGNQVVTVRRIIEQRRLLGKDLVQLPGREAKQKPVSADVLVRSYKKQADRQRSLVRKADVAQRRLMFLATALRRLHADEHFANLLRAEGLPTMPRQLAERVRSAGA